MGAFVVESRFMRSMSQKGEGGDKVMNPTYTNWMLTDANVRAVADDETAFPIMRSLAKSLLKSTAMTVEAKVRLAMADQLLRDVYKQIGNHAPAERRHAVTPGVRDAIRDYLKEQHEAQKTEGIREIRQPDAQTGEGATERSDARA
jgi:hypothetical protein